MNRDSGSQTDHSFCVRGACFGRPLTHLRQGWEPVLQAVQGTQDVVQTIHSIHAEHILDMHRPTSD